MVEVIAASDRAFGRPSKLSHADQVLATLMYWREYRTMFHIATTYKVSEATIWRVIRRTETLLSADERFELPQRTESSSDGNVVEVLVVDVTETPVERPKKKSSDGSTTMADDGIIA
jgi:predicted DNA-binding protein YlxM (UPF0122 family)